MLLTDDYFTGLIDGEGCLDIHKQKYTNILGIEKVYYYPKLSVSNNHLEVLEKMQEHYGCGRIYSDKKKCYILVFHNKECEYILDLIGENLFIKKDEYELMKRYFNNKENEKLYHIELKNRRRGYVS